MRSTGRGIFSDFLSRRVILTSVAQGSICHHVTQAMNEVFRFISFHVEMVTSFLQVSVCHHVHQPMDEAGEERRLSTDLQSLIDAVIQLDQ